MVNNEMFNDNGIVSHEDKVIASKLFRVRTRMEIKRSELAKMTGLSEETIAEYENGLEAVPASDLFMLSNVMGISIDYFYSDEVVASATPENTETVVFS
jgi:transcriptional regulator with XRE-family HTH domain